MSKIINLEIYSCDLCPYCRYDGDYGRSYSSGYDCDHIDAPNNARIIDADGDIRITVPDWCPLPNKGENNV